MQPTTTYPGTPRRVKSKIIIKNKESDLLVMVFWMEVWVPKKTEDARVQTTVREYHFKRKVYNMKNCDLKYKPKKYFYFKYKEITIREKLLYKNCIQKNERICTKGNQQISLLFVD